MSRFMCSERGREKTVMNCMILISLGICGIQVYNEDIITCFIYAHDNTICFITSSVQIFMVLEVVLRFLGITKLKVFDTNITENCINF